MILLRTVVCNKNKRRCHGDLPNPNSAWRKGSPCSFGEPQRLHSKAARFHARDGFDGRIMCISEREIMERRLGLFGILAGIVLLTHPALAAEPNNRGARNWPDMVPSA